MDYVLDSSSFIPLCLLLQYEGTLKMISHALTFCAKINSQEWIEVLFCGVTRGDLDILNVFLHHPKVQDIALPHVG